MRRKHGAHQECCVTKSNGSHVQWPNISPDDNGVQSVRMCVCTLMNDYIFFQICPCMYILFHLCCIVYLMYFIQCSQCINIGCMFSQHSRLWMVFLYIYHWIYVLYVVSLLIMTSSIFYWTRDVTKFSLLIMVMNVIVIRLVPSSDTIKCSMFARIEDCCQQLYRMTRVGYQQCLEGGELKETCNSLA